MHILFAALALLGTPQASPELERILLPIVARRPIAGAHGSLWETVLTVRNASDQTLLYFPTDCPVVPPVPEHLCLQNVPPRLLPGVTKRMDLLAHGPVFLNVTKSLADRTFIQLRVHDLSRQAESFGTEIPVVRAAGMKSTAGQIVDIPRDPRFRLTFRLYADIVDEPSEVRVRVVSERSNQYRELTFTIPPYPGAGPGEEPVTAPALYRELSGIESYPELQDTEKIRIEIEPLTKGVRYWAFVSVTNNETQQITTLTLHMR